MHVVGYVRVSTEEQGRSGLGLEAQQESIERAAIAREWDVVWAIDEGLSARSLSRPGLQTALGYLRRGEADAIVVSRLDRLSRSVQDFAQLLNTARHQGWAVNALDVGVDTTTSAGELVANVMAAVAQWERRVIGERTAAALAAARRRGVILGRPRTLPLTTESRISGLRERGNSLRAIAATLNDEGIPGAHGGRWHPSTVGAVLRRASVNS